MTDQEPLTHESEKLDFGHRENLTSCRPGGTFLIVKKVNVKSVRLKDVSGLTHKGKVVFGLANTKKLKIKVNSDQGALERLDTVVYESLYLLFPSWREKRIRQVAYVVSELLWRDGWRRPKS